MAEEHEQVHQGEFNWIFLNQKHTSKMSILCCSISASVSLNIKKCIFFNYIIKLLDV